MTTTHPFTLARRAVRRAMAYQSTVYETYTTPAGYESSRQTDRKTWARTSSSLTVVRKKLDQTLLVMSVWDRKLRAAVRAHLPAAYASVTGEREPATTDSLADRLRRRLVRRALAAAPSLPAGAAAKHFQVIDRRPAERLALVSGGWWYEYSSRHGSRFNEAAILSGFEDGQRWARRVPPATATVDEALAYVRPAEVNAALAEGREVRRQGDVWLVRLKAGRTNLDALRGTDHRVDGSRLVHPQHAALDLGGGRWKAFLSKDTTRAMRAAAETD